MTTRSEPDYGFPDERLHAVSGERRRLLAIAYRLTGSLAEAEDAVQETYVRWCALSPRQRGLIESPGAWLAKVASRVCLDVLRSARVRRERCVGVWLPEPRADHTEWTTGSSADPGELVTVDEAVNAAFLVVIESMTAAERVAFILHDIFAYPFAEIADITDRTPAACRQLASSARRRIREARVPTAPSIQQAGIIRDFERAWAAKDIRVLVNLLDNDATVLADGGAGTSEASPSRRTTVVAAQPTASAFR